MTIGRIPSIEGGIQPTIFDAKGDVLTATAADTPAVLTVGANDTVLTADSSTATGLKWAAVSAGGMTLLSTTSLANATTLISSISQDYENLYIYAYDLNMSADDNIRVTFRNSSTDLTTRITGTSNGTAISRSGTAAIYASGTTADLKSGNPAATSFNITIFNYNQTATKLIDNYTQAVDKDSLGTKVSEYGGAIGGNLAVNAIYFFSNNGSATMSGTVEIWGVK